MGDRGRRDTTFHMWGSIACHSAVGGIRWEAGKVTAGEGGSGVPSAATPVEK